uniref:DDHD domain-containing protein n=1 Tax=Haemonchus contortus TaxID=6289 RepID=A0A7I5E882_HAECO
MSSARSGCSMNDCQAQTIEEAASHCSVLISHPEGEQKEVTELRCCEVRWFYRKNEVDKWINFNGRDSLFLEAKYRSVFSIPLDEQMTVELLENGFTFRQSVVVLEGLYKANDELTKVEAIYWKGDSCEIRRGTWFFQDWQPLEPPVAEAIEAHHLQYFRGQTIPEGLTVFSAKEASNKPQLTELQLEGMEIRWSSVIDVSLSFKRGAILRYIGWGKSQALRRGFHKEAEWDDGPAEISHLILVVHGIGQKGYENLIAENAQQVREAVVSAIERCYPEEKGRPMFLPVEWRSILKLDDGVTDVITLPKMSSMRNVLNSTAMDIMYYQSPLYRREIISGVVRQLNRIYTLFTENNPSFSGPVSIFAHSLGSVIIYDILLRWSPFLLYDKYVTHAMDTHLEECTDPENREALKAFQKARDVLYEKIDGGINKMLQYSDEELLFKVKYLFAVGSPLAVFLVMRGATHTDLLPAKMNVERIFNIFHPYDPVAYRLEPMFIPEYRYIRPIKLFTSHDMRARGSYDELPLDVYKSYMKKLKNEAKSKKNKSHSIEKSEISNENLMIPTEKSDLSLKTVPFAQNRIDLNDARSGGDDDLDEEDDCDSDYDAKSGCSSPRCVTPPGDGASIEKPAKKGWFSSFTTAAPKKAAIPAAASSEPTVEVAKEAESELPLADRLLGSGVRPPHRMDFQLQPALTDKSYWSVLKSHFSYWTNADLAVFVANVLRGEQPTKSQDNGVGQAENHSQANNKSPLPP